MTTEISINTCA